jgi:hypothetical protein
MSYAAVGVLTLMLATKVFAQANQPPIAAAGPDVQAIEGSFTQLDGSNSIDPDFMPLTYSWVQIAGPTAVVANANTAILDVNVPNVSGLGGMLTFELTVTDDAGDSASDFANVIIKRVNSAPIAAIIAPASVTEGALATLDGSGSYDPNGDAITYTWSQIAGPAVTFDLTDPVRPTFVAPTTGLGAQLRFQLTVSDSLLSSSTLADVIVTVANQPPVAKLGSNQTVNTNQAVTLDGALSFDPDGQSLTYIWTQTAGAAVALDLTNPIMPTFTAPTSAGTLTFSLVVNDGHVNSVAAYASVFVFAAEIPNCANAHANKTQMWPPNHTLSRLKIRGLSGDDHDHLLGNDDGDDGEGDDDRDDSNEDSKKYAVHITNVTQDEPTSGTGPGDVKPDAIVQVNGPDGKPRIQDLVMLRRERADSGNGRVYEITFTATNIVSGAACTGKVQVCTPTKKGKKGLCTNSGQNFNSKL